MSDSTVEHTSSGVAEHERLQLHLAELASVPVRQVVRLAIVDGIRHH